MSPHAAAIHIVVRRVQAATEAVFGPVPMDVVAQVLPSATLPELGISGHCPAQDLVHLNFDPSNPALAGSMGAALERVLAHEVHHAMRWKGPGYGTTLGAALVSEGLAGRFVQELYGNPPELWEAEDAADLDHLATALAVWDLPYDHKAWFFGAGHLPKWVGYRLGYRIVGAHLSAQNMRPSDMVHADYGVFLQSAQTMHASARS